MDGQEHIILVEFCLKYNCTLTARLEYDEVLWGETFHNHTGYGMLGALAMRDANVSVAALYLWDAPYEFIQYSAVIQKAIVTKIVPKPLRLAFIYTPILPFPGYIWGYVISSLIIGAVTLFIVNVSQSKMNVGRNGLVCSYGLFDSIYAVFKMSTFQSIKINITFFSNFAIFAAILIYALVIGNLYSGKFHLYEFLYITNL